MSRLKAYWRLKRRDYKIAVLFLIVAALTAAAILWAWNDYLSSPPYVDKKRYPIRGIDISAHNGMMNFEAVADDGIDFVFIKASEGASFVDSNFRLNYDKATRAGLAVGAYHFFRFDVDGVSQAINLLRVIGDRKLDIGIAVDVEQTGNPDNIPRDSIQDRLTAMTEFLNLKGHRVIFYSNTQGFYNFLAENFKGYPLWICSFSRIPFSEDWTFWQFNHHGRVKGINTDVDINVFYGNHRQWQQYVK